MADAALTTEKCLAKKRQAWSTLRKCEATEDLKRLLGKTTDLAKCETKFHEKLAKIAGKAADAGIACRYGDNGDGTVTDYETGLQWEKKDGNVDGLCLFPDLHCVNARYTWSDATAVFVNRINGTSTDGKMLSGAFAGHSDWRLPTIVELASILDTIVPGCSPAAGEACIDPIFGPTVANSYWSATEDANDPGGSSAWLVFFRNGGNSGFSGFNRMLKKSLRSDG